jgi:hypothetical protein
VNVSFAGLNWAAQYTNLKDGVWTMKQRRRIYYSAAQRSEIWDRWQAGGPMGSIGRRQPAAFVRRFGVEPGRRSVFLNERRFLDGSACAARCGRLRATWDDLRQPSAVKSIAMVGRTAIELPGPISYLGSGAAYQALQAGLPSVAEAESIDQQRQWSPERIAGWLKRTYPGKLQNQVSHETSSLFIQARGVLKKGIA